MLWVDFEIDEKIKLAKPNTIHNTDNSRHLIGTTHWNNIIILRSPCAQC